MKTNLILDEFLKREEEVYNEKRGLRAFAIEVKNYRELFNVVWRCKTPLRPNGFIHYVTGDVSRLKKYINEGYRFILFNEDAGIAYPITKEFLSIRYPGIKIMSDIV